MTLRPLLVITLTAAAASTAAAATTWTLQGKEYNVDTLYHAQIGPGTTQTSLHLTGAQNLKVFYTTTDLTNPYTDLRVAQASNNLVGGARLSSMQAAHTAPGARYFAGVNADFFGGSRPIGSSVCNGDVWYAVNTGWVNWFFTDDRRPCIASLNFTGRASTATANARITGINTDRGENALVIYNSHKGSTTGTNSYGAEVKLEPTDGAVLNFTGTTVWRVACEPNTAGSMAIGGGVVLSGHGVGAEFVKTLTTGDLVTLDLTTNIPGGGTIAQMAGGMPIILQGGVTLDTQGALDHLTALNPRTAVGHSADGTKVVLLVVDGRSKGGSVGVVSRVLADMMRCVGCSDAMNFDGGGSSELYTSAFGVRNIPSDGSERAVVNSVWNVCTAPDDNEVASIAFMNTTISLPRYGYFKPTIYGYNRYGMLVDTDLQGYTLSCSDELGVVSADGSMLFANGTGYHALTATFGEATASIPVAIGTAAPQMRLADGVIVDSYRDYLAEVEANVDGIMMAIDNMALTWSSSDAAVATVSAEGLIAGVSDGEATVTGTVGEFSGTIPVKVQIPTARHAAIDPGLDASTWTVSKVSLSAASVEAYGTDGIALTYTVSSTRGTCVTAKKSIVLNALPDSLRVVFNPGDAVVTKIAVTMGKAGERGTTVTYTPTVVGNADNEVLVPVSDFVDTQDFASYPVEFSSIAFYVSDATKSTHTIAIPELQTVYTAVDPSAGVERVTADAAAERTIAAATGETVTIDVADESAQWTVFAPTGQIVGAGRGILMTAPAARGHYFVTVVQGGKARVLRLIVR